MKAALLDAPGLENLRVGEAKKPQPGSSQVLVRVEAASLNPVDRWLAQDGHPAWEYPIVPGLDVCGIVESVGEGLSADDAARLAPGTRVAFHGDVRFPGAFAEYAVTEAYAAAVVPAGVTAEQAAALPCAALTAYEAVNRRLHAGAGDTLLINAGGGGVGSFCVQLVHLAGATAIAVASQSNHERLRELGADHCIDYHDSEVANQALAITDWRGVDGIVDAVGEESALDLLSALVHGGGLVSIAEAVDATEVPRFFDCAFSIHQVSLGAAHSLGDARAKARLRTVLEELLGLVAAGQLEALVSETLALEDVPANLERMGGRGKVAGKLVVKF